MQNAVIVSRNIRLIIIRPQYKFNMKNEYINHPLINHWFTWNKSINHNKLTCLPIGLNYDRQQIILEKFLNFKPLKPTMQS